LQIINSIDNEVVGFVNHSEFMKELMDYFEYLYSGKGNLFQIYDICKAFYCSEKDAKSLTTLLHGVQENLWRTKCAFAIHLWYQAASSLEGTNGDNEFFSWTLLWVWDC